LDVAVSTNCVSIIISRRLKSGPWIKELHWGEKTLGTLIISSHPSQYATVLLDDDDDDDDDDGDDECLVGCAGMAES